MISQSAFTGLTVPIRWTFSTNSKSEISIFANDLSRSTPALAIRMSTRPQASIACLTMLATPASSATEEPLAIASPPAALISPTTLAAASDDPPVPSTAPPRSLTTTFAPRRASSSACWRPSPPPAPVTIATLPSKRMSAMAQALPGIFERRPSRADAPRPSSDGAPQGTRGSAGLEELHQHALADQEGGGVGADNHLDHPLVGALRGVVGLQLACAEHAGLAQHPSGEHLRGVALGRELHGLADAHRRDGALGDLGAHDVLAGRLQIEHRRHVQRRGAVAGVGVAADDAAVDRRADDGLVERVARFGELRLGGGDHGVLHAERRLRG